LQRLNTERLTQQFPAFQNQMLPDEPSLDFCGDFNQSNQKVFPNAMAVNQPFPVNPAMET